MLWLQMLPYKIVYKFIILCRVLKGNSCSGNANFIDPFQI